MPCGTRVFWRLGVTYCLHLQWDNLVQVTAATRAVNGLDIRQFPFHNNRYSPNEIQPVLYPTHQIRPLRDHKMTTAYLPFIQNSLKCLSMVLSKYIKTVSLPPWNILSPNIYSIPCMCHKVYIGQTDSSIKTMIKEFKELTTTIREVRKVSGRKQHWPQLQDIVQ
jgi:hypothetical protein